MIDLDYKYTFTTRQVKIFKNENDSLSEDIIFKIPFGIIKKPKNGNSIEDELKLYYHNKKIFCEYRGNRKIQIYPELSKKFKNDDQDYVIKMMNTDKDLDTCKSIIDTEHYLPSTKKGVYFMCKDKDDNIVACAVIDKLYHGNPSPRIKIPNLSSNIPDIMKKDWNPATGKEIVDTLKICWLSRLSIIKSKKGKGLGTKFIKTLKGNLNSLHPIEHQNIEVVTSHPKIDAEDRCQTNKHFLSKAGLKCYGKMNSKRLNKLDKGQKQYDRDGNYVLETSRKLYFFGDVK